MRPIPVAELNRVAALLEAQAKGLRHRRHARHLTPAKDRLKALFASYFKRQGAAVLKAVAPHIKRELVSFPPILKESLGGNVTPAAAASYRALYGAMKEASSRGKQFAAGLVPTSLQPLRFAATASERDEFNGAIADLVTGAASTLALQSGQSALKDSADDVASRYLRDNSLSKLTIDLGSETESRLRGALADAWDAGGSYDEMVSAITDTFADFSEVRAGLIAQTEAVDAYNASRSDIAAEAGFDEKSWETESGNPCETCLGNEADGWIGVDETFSSGDDAPTAHPNCECVLNFRSSSDEEE